VTTFNYYFPDNLDFVDPEFDGITNEKTKHHRKYDDDAYPHEILKELPYNGMLVSLAGVGTMQKKGKYYTQELTEDFYYYGAKKFLRLNQEKFKDVLLMGDCGAFDYVNEYEPPYTIDELIEFYDRGGFHYGISLDHIVFQYAKDENALRAMDNEEKVEANRRINITLANAKVFFEKTNHKANFTPYGVAHGYSKETFEHSVKELEKIGYTHITIGGMIKSKTPDLLDLLKALSSIKKKETQFHLLGICRFENIPAYAEYGVTSADSTSPLMQGIKAGKYFEFNDETHELIQSLSIRIRQCDHDNVQKLIDKHRHEIRSLVTTMLNNNEIDIDLSNNALSTNECVKRLETDCIEKLIQYDATGEHFDATFKALMAYEKVTTADHLAEITPVKQSLLSKDKLRIKKFLLERPWKTCSCGVCESGIMNIIFRSNQTNRRRGIHNLAMVTKHKDKVIDDMTPPTIKANK